MATEQVKITFPPDMFNPGAVYEVDTRFGVQIRIRRFRSDLNREGGWMILEVTGAAEEVEKSLAWVKEQGATVEPSAIQL